MYTKIQEKIVKNCIKWHRTCIIILLIHSKFKQKFKKVPLKHIFLDFKFCVKVS